MRLLAAIIALAAVSGTAFAQTYFVNEHTDFSAEPDTNPDLTGVAAAYQAGITGGSPVRILNAKWTNSGIPLVFTSQSQTQYESAALLEALGGPRMLLPGMTGKFTAWYGDWADYDQDKHLPLNSTRHVGASFSDRECRDGSVGVGSNLVTVFPNGGPAGGPYAVPNPLGPQQASTPEAAAADCRAAPEWKGISAATVVGYIEPNRPVNSFGGIPLLPGVDDGSPDLVYGEITFFPEGVRYQATDDGSTYYFFDGSVLETVTVETYVNPLATHDGDRTVARNQAEPHDIDTYVALDGTAEGLFKTLIVDPLAARGCAKGDWLSGPIGDADCRAGLLGPAAGAAGAVTGALGTAQNETFKAVDPAVGPTQGSVFPVRGLESYAFDYASEPHTYFDVTFDVSGYQPLVGTWNDFSLASVSMDADGEATGSPYHGVYGTLGLWHDKDENGFIGTGQEPTPGCDDEHDCGTVQDPNNYASDEYVPFCRDVDETKAIGEIGATLTSSSGNWGSGVYVLADEDPGLLWGGYNDRTNAHRGFNPWDDVADDASDGSVDQLHTDGELTVRLICNEEGGGYWSVEHFMFLDGANRDYTITLATEAFENTVQVKGAPVTETMQDTDVISAAEPIA